MRVNIDYHVAYEACYYSVPYRLGHETVELRATEATLGVFHRGERVATHRRSHGSRGSAVTDAAHRPANHRDQVWPPERLIAWGAKYGPAVATVIEQMLTAPLAWPGSAADVAAADVAAADDWGRLGDGRYQIARRFQPEPPTWLERLLGEEVV